MSQLVLMMSVSLDGFFEGPDRELDWQLVDEELHTHFNDWLRTAGMFLDGRVTYELMAGFWPTADADPATTGPVAEFAAIWRGMPKIVYSKTLERADGNASIVRGVDPDEVRDLKTRSAGDLVLGGATIGAEFMRQGLVDELRIYVHPVVLGAGRPLFQAGANLSLRLLESLVFGNGVVLLRYGVRGD